MNIKIKIIAVLCMTIFLWGCLYPQAEKMKNQGSYKSHIEMVQSAVNQFQEAEGGILPIVTKEATTPIYHKYPIKFSKISPKYIAEPPESAFESGGVFQYVLVNVEESPTVKLLDLRMADKIQELNLRLSTYRREHGFPPFKERLANNAFTIDFEKLGLKEQPTVISPYSQKNLHVILNEQGELHIDYTPDLMDVLKDYSGVLEEGEDIRRILVETSDFVPAYSLPYTIDKKENRPIFLIK